MRIRWKYNGTAFEYSRRPMSERRFKALCALAAAGIYMGAYAGSGGRERLPWTAGGGIGLSVAAMFFRLLGKGTS